MKGGKTRAAQRQNANNRGAAMILVLFTFMLILALGAIALRAADAALHTATDGTAQKQAELLAISYAETLAAELQVPNGPLCEAAKALENGDALAVEGSADGAFAAAQMNAVCTRSEDTLACAVTCAWQNTEYSLSVRLQLVELEGGTKAWQLLAYGPLE